MIKYVPEDTSVVFSEIPGEVTLAFNISNCRNRCKGCHTPYLQTDTGDELAESVVDGLIAKNAGITCICFMGEGNDEEALYRMAKHIKAKHSGLKLGIYSGRDGVERWYSETFDYIKLGRYDENMGAINKVGTNQRLYKRTFNPNDITKIGEGWQNITPKMQKPDL